MRAVYPPEQIDVVQLGVHFTGIDNVWRLVHVLAVLRTADARSPALEPIARDWERDPQRDTAWHHNPRHPPLGWAAARAPRSRPGC